MKSQWVNGLLPAAAAFALVVGSYQVGDSMLAPLSLATAVGCSYLVGNWGGSMLLVILNAIVTGWFGAVLGSRWSGEPELINILPVFLPPVLFVAGLIGQLFFLSRETAT